MKILLIANSISGGAGKACRRLYESLKLSGINVKILHLEGGSEADKNIVSMYSSISKLFLKQIINIPKNKLSQMYFGSLNTNYRLPISFHNLEKHPLIDWADIINLHWVPEFLDYKSFFSNVSKPIVWTLHDMLPFSGGYHYILDIQNKNKQIEDKISTIKLNAVKNSNLTIVAPSNWLVNISKNSTTFNSKKHHHIFNPIPSLIFKPTEKKIARRILNLPENGKILIFSADSLNSKRKGMKLLIDAFDFVNDNDLTLVSIGRGKFEKDLKIPYIHLGLLKDDYTIALLYSAADLSVVPSREDNSPNTILESLACGCPVVAFNNGGMSELISSEDYGVIVSEYNPKSLAIGINKSLNFKYKTNLITKHVNSECHYSVVSSRYLKIFKNL